MTPSATRRGAWLKRASFVLLVAGLFLGLPRFVPQETTLHYPLDGRGEGLTAMRVALLRAGERSPVRTTEFHFSERAPAPREQAHVVRLLRGRYRVEVTLRRGESETSFFGGFDFDGDAAVTVALAP
jgi:hypothetical protein